MTERYEIEQRDDGRYQIRDHELPRPDGTPRIIGYVSEGFENMAKAEAWLTEHRTETEQPVGDSNPGPLHETEASSPLDERAESPST